jgi:hypothetical protein
MTQPPSPHDMGPLDRSMIAQARAAPWPIVTLNCVFREYGVKMIWQGIRNASHQLFSLLSVDRFSPAVRWRSPLACASMVPGGHLRGSLYRYSCIWSEHGCRNMAGGIHRSRARMDRGLPH